MEINLQHHVSEDQDALEIFKEVSWLETMIEGKQFNKEVMTVN